MNKYNVTVVFTDGLSSIITNVVGNSRTAVFYKMLEDFKRQEVMSITVVERKIEPWIKS